MFDDPFRFIVVLVIGTGAQFVDGVLGMGFGVFSISWLLATGVPPTVAVATVNVAKIVTGLFSGLAHWRAGNVRRAWLPPLIVAGTIGAALGVAVLASLPPERLRSWMGLVLVGMGALMLWRAVSPSVPSALPTPDGDSRLRLVRHLRLGVLGLVAGFLNAISGTYGPFATAAVMLTERAKPFRAVGTVSVAEFFVAIAVISTLASGVGARAFAWDLALGLTMGGGARRPSRSVCMPAPTFPCAEARGRPGADRSESGSRDLLDEMTSRVRAGSRAPREPEYRATPHPRSAPVVSGLSGWLPVVIWTLLTLALASRPYTSYFSDLEGAGHRLFQRYLQYPVHAGIYGTLGVLWIRALLRHRIGRGRVFWITLAAVAFTAFLDESIQHFVPTRSFALRDLVMDGTGGILAVALARWLLPATGGQG